MYVSKKMFQELQNVATQLNYDIKNGLYSKRTINFIDKSHENKNGIGNVLSNPAFSIASNIHIVPAKHGGLFHVSYRIGLTKLTANDALKLVRNLIHLGRNGIAKRAERNIRIQNHTTAMRLSMDLI